MLKNFTRGACAAVALLALTSLPAQADDGDGVNGINHVIEIVDGAYLPIISYVNPGDHLVFENGTDSAKVVSGPDDSWTSGPIAPGGRFLVQIGDDMPKTFSGEDIAGIQIAGEYTFDPAPTTD